MIPSLKFYIIILSSVAMVKEKIDMPSKRSADESQPTSAGLDEDDPDKLTALCSPTGLTAELNNETSELGENENPMLNDDSVPSSRSMGTPINAKTNLPVSSNKSMTGFSSLDKDVENVDLFLYRMSFYVVISWLVLIALSYFAAPEDSIVRLTGTERTAALMELCVLTTAVIMRHGILLWDMKREVGSIPLRISGVLAGGLTVQFVAVFTVVWMVAFPVPVMIDPVFHSRVHLLRWCEWTPLAGFMTLLMQCIDAPTKEDGKWSTKFKEKTLTASLESISTFCGMLFPFCPNQTCWIACMIISFITYSSIFFSYVKRAKEFRGIVRGESEDHIELYERSRLSLALHWMCCFSWTMITVSYFVSSCSHLIVPKSYKWLHDPAIVMIEECIMDCLAKVLYMSLIIEADSAAFDEIKRANRRLVELKNTMSAVWENSSDTIAISVEKISGNMTSMVSPSFFKDALVLKQEELNNISAVVLELEKSCVKKKRNSSSNVAARVATGDLPRVGMKTIRKEDFSQLDLDSSESRNIFDPVAAHQRGAEKIDLMTYRAVAFCDMMSRAWQTTANELVFEHDVHPREGTGPRAKYEVKVTRLGEHAIVVVIRDVSERYRRFEAEKRFIVETTARQKDADANRFTRHEVKNGILSAIEICSNIREQISSDFNKLLQTTDGQNIAADSAITKESMAVRVESITELDMTLHEILDIVLAETMARDVIHEMYEPKMNRVDINHLLSRVKGLTGSNVRFEFMSSPSPLPLILSDHSLFKCIYSNAIRNAIKYGKPGGKIITNAMYYANTKRFEMQVINEPGPEHQTLVDLGSRASDLVFSHGTRLHKKTSNLTKSLSAGDGAWIIRKCATILGGDVDISFDQAQTIFRFEAPVELYDAHPNASDFVIPQGVWGIAIDDSKIQRKLLRRFFVHAGIKEHYQIILGQNSAEITNFVDFVINFVKKHPQDRFFLLVDENLEVEEDLPMRHETLSGSKCIQHICMALEPCHEERVLAVVRSANDSQDDLAIYSSRAHGCIPKAPLDAFGVKETVYSIWNNRFPPKDRDPKMQEGKSEEENEITRVSSLENLRDLTVITSAELSEEVKQIDALCIRNHTEHDMDDRWHSTWDKLHKLKGDLQSANLEGRYNEVIEIIETLRGENAPTDFIEKWLSIRSKVIGNEG